MCIRDSHKAIHRNWLADTCNLSLYEDKTFPLPDNFFDDYEGRPAAAAQEMSMKAHVDKHLSILRFLRLLLLLMQEE